MIPLFLGVGTAICSIIAKKRLMRINPDSIEGFRFKKKSSVELTGRARKWFIEANIKGYRQSSYIYNDDDELFYDTNLVRRNSFLLGTFDTVEHRKIIIKDLVKKFKLSPKQQELRNTGDILGGFLEIDQDPQSD